MKMVPLGDLMPTRTQSLNPAKHAEEEFELHSIPAFDRGRPDISLGRDIGSSKQVVQPGDVLISKIVPHIRRSAVIPKLAGRRQLASSEWIVFRNQSFDPKYLVHFLMSDVFHHQFLNTVAGVGGSLLRARPQYVRSIMAPLPPLDEQRRIAAILDKADAIRQNRRQATTHLDTLTQSIFYRMFLTHQEWETCPLGTIADVDSGITKGRKAKDVALSQTPYLAVSNVQDGYLDLTNVKHIAATAAEIKRFKLLPGDLLLTEGGDPDKLGRGSVWNGEIAGCIHQNHIFRVRLNQTSPVTSFFFSQYLRTHEAKQYFLKSAKQTTGIASINKTQLSKFPVPLVPEEDQTRFAKYSLAISRRRDTSMKSLSTAESLFASLQAQAFRGEL